MKRTYEAMLEKAHYYQLNIDLCKNLYFQINSVEELNNLVIFLKNEQKFNFILIAQLITSFFDVPYYKAAALYREFNPQAEATQTQFKIQKPLFDASKNQMIELIKAHSELLNAISNTRHNVKNIALLLEQSENTVRKKLKELIDNNFIVKENLPKQREFYYSINKDFMPTLQKIANAIA